MRVLLLAGSWSPEAEVSLKGAKNIQKALEERGHIVTLCDPINEFDSIIDKAKMHDVSFINLHGVPGEDGLIQAMLTQAGCKFQGSSAQGSYLALNKAAAKQVYKHAGIKTAEWNFLPVQPNTDWKPSFAFPVFIKSNTGGSSINLAKINKFEDLHRELAILFNDKHEVLVEPLIEGLELTCGVLDIKGETKALPPVLIKPKGTAFFDYTMKYADDGAEEICPAPIDDVITKNIQEIALKAHNALGLRGYSRSDFILTKDNQLYILETNTLPGMTSASLIPKEAAAIGISFGELLDILLENAINS